MWTINIFQLVIANKKEAINSEISVGYWMYLNMEGKRRTLNAAENFKTKMQKEIIIKNLKRNGHRLTKQRLTLINIILENNCASCKEIYYKASKVDRKIGVATTYRMVRLLEEIGAITRDNLYKLEYKIERKEEKYCNVKLEDGSLHPMPLRDFEIALNAGMSTCGFFSGHQVVSVEMNGERIEWEIE